MRNDPFVYALNHTLDITPQEMSHHFIRLVQNADFDAADTIDKILNDKRASMEFELVSISWTRKLAEARRRHLTDKHNDYSAEAAEAAAPKLFGLKTDRYSDDLAEQMLYEPRNMQQRFSELAFRYLDRIYGDRFPSDRDDTWYQMPES